MKKWGCLSIFLYCFSSNSFAQTVNTDSLLQVLTTAKEDTNKVNIYKALTGTLRFSDPDKAIELGQKAILLSSALHFDKGTAIAYLHLSTAYANSGKQDTALLYLDTAIQYSQRVGDPNRLGLAYLNRADVHRQMQNFSKALKDCDTALLWADKADNNDVRARVSQTIGTMYYYQLAYPQSIEYLQKAIALYRKDGNMRMTAAAMNNVSLSYKSIKDYPKAIAATTEAIRIADSMQDIPNLSIFTGNLCDLYFEMGNYSQAEKYAGKAMAYAIEAENDGQIAIAREMLGNVYVKQKRYTEAIAILHKALSVFTETEDIDRINVTADLLAEAYSLDGDYAKAYEYQLLSKSTGDSLARMRYSEDVAAMQTRFRVNEKDKEIQLLAKDSELQGQKLRQQNILLIASIAVAVLALAGIWLAINRFRLRQRVKELELRNRIAADLHDEVGSSLSSIHMLSQMALQKESGDAAQKNILARMGSNARETMEVMGDIVWMIKPGETEAGSLKQRMERFAYEMCGSKNITAVLQLEGLEKVKLNMQQRKNSYLIFKEALNNAVKYSGTGNVYISAVISGKELILMIKDDGRGFDSRIVRKGNGLDNMQTRARESGATLTITSSENEGTTIKLVLSV